MRTLGFLSIARARHRSWRWPWERLLPDSVTVDERLRNMFLFVIGVEVPVGVSGTPLTLRPGVVGREAVKGVEGFVGENGAPIN